MLTDNVNQYAIDYDDAPRMSARVVRIMEIARRKDALLARVPLDPAFLKECDYGDLPEGLEKSASVREELEKAVRKLIAG